MNIDPEYIAAAIRLGGVLASLLFGFTVCGCLLVTITDYVNRREFRAWMDEETGE